MSAFVGNFNIKTRQERGRNKRKTEKLSERKKEKNKWKIIKNTNEEMKKKRKK